MFDEMTNLFGNCREAVVAVKDGKIIYCNEAAEKMFPKIRNIRPEEIFPEDLLSSRTGDITEEVEIEGKRSMVSVTSFDGYRIFSVAPRGAGCPSEMGNLIVAIIAELRNTLSVLKMASGLLLPHVENMEDERLLRYSSMIYHCYYNLLRVTNNLSDLGGLMSDSLSINRSFYDVVLASRELLSSVRHLVEDRGIRLRFESNEDSLYVYADRRQLNRLILNLISNSLQNTPPGGEVVLSVMSAKDKFILSVSDNGTGIRSSVMRTVWSRYGEPKDLSDPNAGVGLGLTVVQAIARLHGGSAVLESRQGEGTTVTVSIPMETPQTTGFKESIVDYEPGGMEQILTELAGVVSYEKYRQFYMD